MQFPVIRRRSIFFRNPRGGKQEKFDVVFAVSRYTGDADSSQAAEEAIKEVSEIFEQLVLSGKIPVNNPRVQTDNGSEGRSARSSPVSVVTGKPVLQGKGNDL